MTLVEVLLLEESSGLSSKLIQHFSVDLINNYDIPVMRLEIDPELVVLIYMFNNSVRVRDTLLDNIIPHIKGILVLTEGEGLQNLVFPENLVNRLSGSFGKLPTILAVTEEDGGLQKIPVYILEHGLYLGPTSRMVFFDGRNPETVKRVWKLCLVNLLG